MILALKEKWLKYIGKANKIREKFYHSIRIRMAACRSQSDQLCFAIYFDLCDDIEFIECIDRSHQKEAKCYHLWDFCQSFAYEIFHRYGHNELILEWLESEAGFKKCLK